MANTLFGLLVSGLFLVAGFVGIFWPTLIHSLDTENDSTSTSHAPQQLWAIRISSLVMFLLGCAGIYAILTWDGTPADGPLF